MPLGMGQGLSLEQASEVLKTTKPLVIPLVAIGLTDPKQKRINEQLYDEQIESIKILGRGKSPAYVLILIPFLDYPIRGFSYTRLFAYPKKEDINQTRNNWPAFSALLSIPGSSQVLMDYSLNEQNDLRYRMATLNVLRYLDINKFSAVKNSLNKELVHLRPDTKIYLNAIESGNHSFNGLYHGKIDQ